MDPRGTDSVKSGAPAGTPAAVPEDSPVSNNTDGNRLEKILPEIKDLAQKVGGYGKLADIARELDAAGR
jgi:hypothetical protein